MPSTISTPTTARIANDDLADLRDLAQLTGRTVSALISIAVRSYVTSERERIVSECELARVAFRRGTEACAAVIAFAEARAAAFEARS